MLDSITTLILTIVGAFIASVLYDRFKRPTPRYTFEFNKKVPYESKGTQRVEGLPMLTMVDIPITKYLGNYIYIKNYSSTVPLYNISTEIHFDSQQEQLHYETMEIRGKLFNFKMEYLPEDFSKGISKELFSLSNKSKIDTFEEKRKTGFFISSSDMKKLKCLTPIKVKVKYEWDKNKKDSDIWLADFSDENEVRFRIRSPAIWRKIILFFKRRFL